MMSKKPKGMVLRQKLQRFMTRHREKVGSGIFRPHDFEITEIEVPVKNLDPLFHNYTIVQLTDIHLGQWITPYHLKGIIELVNEQDPDLVALTGDYVSYLLEGYEEDLTLCLKNLEPLDVSLAVLGNHDHWLGAGKIRNILKNSGVIDVSNQVYTLKREDASLHVAGLDSVMLNQHRLDEVMSKVPKSGPAILMVHEPDFADISSATGRFSLQLSGHSHGGQCTIPGWEDTIIRGPHFKKYPSGEYKVGEMTQYTSRGVGTNIFWFRINCPPEISIINLKSPGAME
ncbi:metallophosphoesterase [Methanobacterium alkalithermotolerans]|uniref:Metallophosphoesterase n=1 Tax=Methanobacterium alkalithermotolerans TaxID=2731220 RepID=A0A8T8K6Q9_9EURY|nr:metallophosphoesterase [Methanobacterium alkalithermotolerans]QUH24328.1 metallophosphoesterase [Methanobacterium alkalithermotolerans]RJS48720.1 MAG: metallophosphatase [Methanobacterium sp.]